jgi:hypothetical protein
MSEMITRAVNDLPEPERRSLEHLLGCPLEANQQVFVMVLAAGETPDRETRRAAAESIRHTLAEVDQHRAKSGTSDDEFDAAVDEAMHHVRPRSG